MNADSRKEKLFGTIEAFIKTEVLDAYNNGYKDGERAGKIIGNEKGIEIGKASAAGLIAGLRQLLGGLGFDVPAGLPPMIEAARAEEFPHLAEIERQVAGRELVDLATGEIFEGGGPITDEVVARAYQVGEVTGEIIAGEKLLQENPGVNFPGYSPLDVPVGECSVCNGFGVIEGELYGAPCLIPCSLCTAGEQVKATGELDLTRADAFEEFAEAIETAEAGARSDVPFEVDEIPEVKIPEAKVEELAGEKPFGSVCLNQSCVNYNQAKANCDNPATPRLCAEALTLTKPAAAETVIECFNEKCEYFDDTFVGGCAVPIEKRNGHPLTACPEFLATAPEAPAAAPDYECCRLCSLPDPDCSACGLIDKEINERVEARTAPIELAKCANGSCTATGKDAKDVCLRISGGECKNFVPLADCKHNSSKNFNDELGSLVCGVCGKVIQLSRRAAALASSPTPEGGSQAAAAPSPADEKKLRLQAKCTHPADFMNVIPGRGEVCTICDLTLTPETLPLFKEEAITITGQGEVDEEEIPLTQAGGLDPVDPGIEEEIELVPDCDHPQDLRIPSPEMKNGERIGSIVTCGGCKRVTARFDLDRRPVPPELWPENGGTIDKADIRRHGYKPSELKMIKAGFSLIRYDRDDKNLYRTCNDPALGRFLVLHGKTFADCERRLAEELKDPKLVQVTADGSAADRHAEAKLRGAGFEFYRFEKSSPGASPKIKVGSRNWGMLEKYRSDAELEIAWKKLLTEDPLALQG